MILSKNPPSPDWEFKVWRIYFAYQGFVPPPFEQQCYRCVWGPVCYRFFSDSSNNIQVEFKYEL